MFVRLSPQKKHQEHNDNIPKMRSYISFIIAFILGVTAAVLWAWTPVFHTPEFLRLKLTDVSFLPNSFSSRHDIDETVHELTLQRKVTNKVELRNEALASMHLALDMQAKGKVEKAAKLFHHAYLLDPLHADVLYEYGQHVEEYTDDVIFAAHLYTKALVLNPDHSRAIIRHQRLERLVREIDQQTFSRIDHKRDDLYRIPESHPGLRRIKQESYFQHIYHTVAIEGNSMTYSQARAIIETRMAVAGKSIMEHNELLGVDAALRYVNSTLLRRVGKIQLNDLLEIHKRILWPIDPVEAGRLRRTQVFVAEHRPPRALDVPTLMENFIAWINAPVTLRLHPIEYAALAHYKLVVIHPFYDGNGRTARLLMNLILMQSGYPPVTIRVEEKHTYFKHLVTANEGDVGPFIRFIADCTEKTLDLFLVCASDTHDLALTDSNHEMKPTAPSWTNLEGP